MTDSKIYQIAYVEFCRLRDRYWEGINLPFLDYERFKFGAHMIRGPVLFFYARHAEGYARQLLNDIHLLRCYLEDLRCWRQVLEAASEHGKRELIFEFLQERTMLAITRPAAIKGRFVYAATKLGQVRADVSNVDELPDEQGINEREMKQWVGTWPDFPEFASALGALDSKAYRHATKNFRNLDAHRFPPCIEMGLAPAEGVFTDNGKVCYSVNFYQPLKLEEIGRLLTVEYGAMVTAMDAFWKLIAAQAEPLLQDEYRIESGGSE